MANGARTNRDAIVAYADELLDVEAFPEYGRPGLQVVGADEVSKLVCGVSCSKELFEQAGARGAQMVLVHHGLFWRNEPLVVDRRLRGRLAALFAHDLSLVAYHLALDAHPEVGNSALLARALGIEPERSFGAVGVGGRLGEPVSIEELADRVREAVDREPLVFAEGHSRLERVAVSTGAGGYDLIAAA